jgi:hypothetical protein
MATRLAHLHYNQNYLGSLEEMSFARCSPCNPRHAVALPGLDGPCNRTGQMGSMAVCPDWSLAVWKGRPASVIGFVACSARCNDGTRNVKVEGWTPGPPTRGWDRLHTIFARSRSGRCPNLAPLPLSIAEQNR